MYFHLKSQPRNLVAPYSSSKLVARSSSGVSVESTAGSSSSLTLIASALLLHSSIFIIVLLLRRFSPSKVLERAYLTVLFGTTLSVLALIFYLLNRHHDPQLPFTLQTTGGTPFALFFIVDHVAIELLLTLQILIPAAIVKRWPGWILLLVWIALCLVSVAASLSPFDRLVDVIAWTACASDLFLIISGILLIVRWVHGHRDSQVRKASLGMSKIAAAKSLEPEAKRRMIGQDLKPQDDGLHNGVDSWQKRYWVEGLAGLAFVVHGLSSLPVPTMWTLVAHRGFNINFLIYTCMAAVACSFITLAFCLPSATLFFSNIRSFVTFNWRNVPNQASEPDARLTSAHQPSRSRCHQRGGHPSDIQTREAQVLDSSNGTLHSLDLPRRPSNFTPKASFSNWFSAPGSSEVPGIASTWPTTVMKPMPSPGTDPVDQWEKLQQQYVAAQAHAFMAANGSLSYPASRSGSTAGIGALNDPNAAFGGTTSNHLQSQNPMFLTVDGRRIVADGQTTVPRRSIDKHQSGQSAGVGSSITAAGSGLHSHTSSVSNVAHSPNLAFGHSRRPTQDSGISTHTTTFLPEMPVLTPPPPVPSPPARFGNAFAQMQHMQLSSPTWMYSQTSQPAIVLRTDPEPAPSHIRSQTHTAIPPSSSHSSLRRSPSDINRKAITRRARSQTQVRSPYRRGSSLARLASLEQHVQQQLMAQQVAQEVAQRQIHQLLEPPKLPHPISPVTASNLDESERIMNAHRRIFGSTGSAHRRVFGSNERVKTLDSTDPGDVSAVRDDDDAKTKKLMGSTRTDNGSKWAEPRSRQSEARIIGPDGKPTTTDMKSLGIVTGTNVPPSGLGLFPPISPSGYWTSLAAKYGARGELGKLDGDT